MDYVMVRSAKYQYLYNEIHVGDDVLATYSGKEEYDDYLMGLNDVAFGIFMREIRAGLTSNQFEIVSLTLAGLTQDDIAKKLGMNQSSVTKSLHGNLDYNRGKRFGGTERAVARILKNSNEWRAIINVIYIYIETGVRHDKRCGINTKLV